MKAINLLHGRLIGGRHISVQMAKYDNKSNGKESNSGGISKKWNLPVKVVFGEISVHVSNRNGERPAFASILFGSYVRKEVWATKEGSLQVVYVVDSVFCSGEGSG